MKEITLPNTKFNRPSISIENNATKQYKKYKSSKLIPSHKCVIFDRVLTKPLQQKHMHQEIKPEERIFPSADHRRVTTPKYSLHL